ncbi:MAG: T9SS type A sorting domain-containing protein, partial [Saprospiraceae bacterium]
NTVGILGSNGGGTPPPADLHVNPGQNLILYADRNKTTLHLVTPQGTTLASPLSRIAPLSKPSVTDDGTLVLYIAQDKTMRGIIFNWNRGTYEEIVVSDEPIWRNVAISRDGSKLAALTDAYDNIIYVSDIITGNVTEFELYNPTYTQGVSTGDVQYADVLEWDYSGEYIMYDAFNKIGSSLSSIEYWDIGLLQVWDNSRNNFANGFISKLYSALPENVSIGNPTFSKNTPYIIAFDYLDEVNEEYYILGTNVENGDLGIIYQNSDIGFPNYAVNDKQILFDGVTTAGNQVLAVVNLAADKINAQNDPPVANILVSGGNNGARWGVWFANGKRQLTDNEAVKLFDQSLKIFPNPFAEIIYLRGASAPGGMIAVEVFDQIGQQIKRLIINTPSENWEENLDLRNLPAGNYVIRVRTESGSTSRNLSKIK